MAQHEMTFDETVWKRESSVLVPNYTHYNLKLHCPKHNSVLGPATWINLVETMSAQPTFSLRPELKYSAFAKILFLPQWKSKGYSMSLRCRMFSNGSTL